MRLGFDLLYAQREEGNQGIGNYSFGHLTHLTHHKQVDPFYFQPIVDSLDRAEWTRQLRTFLEEYHIDVFHLPSPMSVPYPEVFWSGELPAVRFTATVYDLIPLRFPSVYLPTAAQRTDYEKHLKLLRHMHHLFAISEFTRQDLLREGFSPNDITPIGAGRDESFFVYPGAELSDFTRQFPTHAPYVLAVNPYDFRKNTERLIAAFAKSLQSINELWNLVITNYATDEVRQHIQRVAEQSGIANRVYVLGRVTKSQLLRLYNRAHVFAFPSLYEGLGLPLIESMQCGTPIVTSNCTSIPEVVGSAALLVDPQNMDSIAAGLSQLMTSSQKRAQLRDLGLAQAGEFSWTAVAEHTFDTLQALLQQPYVSLADPSFAIPPETPSEQTFNLRPNRYRRLSPIRRSGRRVCYVSFNLAVLPPGSVIQQAVLHVPVASRQTNLRMRPIHRGWDVKSILRRRPLLRRRIHLTAITPPSRTTLFAGQRFSAWDCTELARDWYVNQLQNHGLHLRPVSYASPFLTVTVHSSR